jgi:hypothetical protein
VSDLTPDLDLGHGHLLTFFEWAPDDLPANRERFGYPLPHIERAGASIDHPRPDGTGPCLGSIHFDIPEFRQFFPDPGRALWQVESWDPLTLSPSVLCRGCGDHGFIRGGRWVPA